MMTIAGLSHITLRVSSLSRSIAFYRDVLGGTLRATWKRGAYLELGPVWLCFLEGTPSPTDDGSHLAFSVPRESFESLSRALIEVDAGRWRSDTSEGRSHYFLDPDGHRLEIHVGDLESRLLACRHAPYEDMVFYP